jgi:peptidoglycan hydrolase CwlO-like protein
LQNISVTDLAKEVSSLRKEVSEIKENLAKIQGEIELSYPVDHGPDKK